MKALLESLLLKLGLLGTVAVVVFFLIGICVLVVLSCIPEHDTFMRWVKRTTLFAAVAAALFFFGRKYVFAG